MKTSHQNSYKELPMHAGKHGVVGDVSVNITLKL